MARNGSPFLLTEVLLTRSNCGSRLIPPMRCATDRAALSATFIALFLYFDQLVYLSCILERGAIF
jgi:hypothetical protein